MLQKISFEDLAKILFTPFVHISHENTKIAIISARLLTFQAFLELLVLRLYLLTFCMDTPDWKQKQSSDTNMSYKCGDFRNSLFYLLFSMQSFYCLYCNYQLAPTQE